MLKIIRNVTVFVLMGFPSMLCAMDNKDEKTDAINQEEAVYVAFKQVFGPTMDENRQARAQEAALADQIKEKDAQAKREFKQQWGIFVELATAPEPKLESARAARTRQIFNALEVLPGLAEKMAFKDRLRMSRSIITKLGSRYQREAYKPLFKALLPTNRKLFVQSSEN
jgi:hypothetical protein